MKEYKHVVWAVAIENSIISICWTALAIVFGKWWIALFAGLFFSTIKRRPNEEDGEQI